jgi:NAD(P)-dependent dehydrogenase (short-subunit alcohol dehydrogenase family)
MSTVVLVTGASSGIGAAIARAFVARGHTVFGTSRSPANVPGTDLTLLPLDVTSDESVHDCVAAVLQRTGRLDVLVNNAGYVLQGAIEETTIEEIRAQLDTNFFGVVRMTKAVLPAMRQAGSGHIITIGSAAGIMALPFTGFYSASKFALEGYCEALSHEVRQFGIRVSLIEPGFVRTPISQATRTAANPIAAYDQARSSALASIASAVEHGSSPELVAERVVRVTERSSPNLRFRVGNDVRLLPLLRTLLPWRAFAGGVRRMFKLPK